MTIGNTWEPVELELEPPVIMDDIVEDGIMEPEVIEDDSAAPAPPIIVSDSDTGDTVGVMLPTLVASVPKFDSVKPD